MVDPPVALRTICRKNDLLLTDRQLSQLEAYVGCLVEWNSKINLISRRDVENIWFSHILHSLALLFSVEIPERWRLLDLGSGGGLPGIPLAIVRPDLVVTLLDSIRKKTMVMDEITRALDLKNVTVKTGRAEDMAGGTGGDTFDTVVARAVASLGKLARWSRPLVRKGRRSSEGERKPAAPHLLALKGGDLTREIAAAQKTGGVAITVIEMVFDGNLELGLEDKKLVCVNFS